MTDNNHPITPPPELVKQWIEQYGNSEDPCWQAYEQDIATQAARWGYEQRGAEIEDELQKARDEELEACCKWIEGEIGAIDPKDLFTARRPKPPSLQDQALDDLERIAALLMKNNLPCDTGNIRRALETLPE